MNRVYAQNFIFWFIGGTPNRKSGELPLFSHWGVPPINQKIKFAHTLYLDIIYAKI